MFIFKKEHQPGVYVPLSALFQVKNDLSFFIDDVRVKVPSFQKVTQILQYKIFHRGVIRLNFVCLKIFLTAVI